MDAFEHVFTNFVIVQQHLLSYHIQYLCAVLEIIAQLLHKSAGFLCSCCQSCV